LKLVTLNLELLKALETASFVRVAWFLRVTVAVFVLRSTLTPSIPFSLDSVARTLEAQLPQVMPEMPMVNTLGFGFSITGCISLKPVTP